jgi:hypothetical protein
MNRIGRQSPILRITIAATCALMASLSYASTREFDVRSGELRPALDAYIAQSGVQLIYKIEDVKDLSTRGVKGNIVPETALDRLLDGTRLHIRRGPDGAIVLIAPPTTSATNAPAAADRKP